MSQKIELMSSSKLTKWGILIIKELFITLTRERTYIDSRTTNSLERFKKHVCASRKTYRSEYLYVHRDALSSSTSDHSQSRIYRTGWKHVDAPLLWGTENQINLSPAAVGKNMKMSVFIKQNLDGNILTWKFLRMFGIACPGHLSVKKAVLSKHYKRPYSKLHIQQGI